MIHNIKLNLTKEDYKNLVLYYKSNEEKQYIKTDIEID
jgi:spore coat protein CotH